MGLEPGGDSSHRIAPDQTIVYFSDEPMPWTRSCSSCGDHLRCGAITRFAPVMESVTRAAQAGVPVLGICNGFPILREAHLCRAR